MRVLLACLIVILSAAPALAQRFVAIAFHDVVDDERDLGPDDISTGQLVSVFDWLKGNGWSSISLDDIEAARSGRRPLPPKPILLTFDDGYASIYDRVYPLLLAYGFHAVFSLTGSWMDAGPNDTVRYGDNLVPRSRFVSWEHAREMAASGFAEFASHSYNLHRGVSGNPQGSMLPAAATWEYDQRSVRYETDAALQARVLADLRRSIALMRTHLGRAPRALAWPFGRAAGPAQNAAQQAGFRFILRLEPEPADASRPLAISRFYPSRTPTLSEISAGLRFANPDPRGLRLICLGLDSIVHSDALETEAALGRTIEDVRRLGATTVLLDPMVAGGPTPSVWFPGSLLPMKADFLGFAAWQLRSRAGVDVFLRVDLHAAAIAVGTERVPEFVREMMRVAPVDGIGLDPSGAFLRGGSVATPAYPWIVRAARDALQPSDFNSDDRLALEVWRAAEGERPGLQLGIVTSVQPPGEWPAPAADWVLLPPANDDIVAMARRLKALGWLVPATSSRMVLRVPADRPDALVKAMRTSQALGATAFALCPAPALPTSAEVNATFSVSRFPRLP
jgi:poly-beta-1,6-N-acetyl-D-glucosamine N-deacetylase